MAIQRPSAPAASIACSLRIDGLSAVRGARFRSARDGIDLVGRGRKRSRTSVKMTSPASCISPRLT